MEKRKKSDASKAVPSAASEGLLASLPTQESVQESALISPELTNTDTTLPESVVTEGSLTSEVSPDTDSIHNESEWQQLVSTAVIISVSTELTSKEISRLQEES